MHDGKYYLKDVLRGRYDYPALKRLAIAHADVHRPTQILIEDSGVGTALIAELRRGSLNVKPIEPERDKVSRMSVASASIEAGQVFFPSQAPWLASLEEDSWLAARSPWRSGRQHQPGHQQSGLPSSEAQSG